MKFPKIQPAAVSRGGLYFALRQWLRDAWSCLGWRLVAILTASLIVLLGASGWFALELHRQHLMSLLEENAVGTGETILSSAHSSMLENDRAHLSQLIQNIGRRENVLALRLLDARGEVRYSSRSAELGQVIDLDAPSCQGCHSGNEVRSPATLQDGLQLYTLPLGRHSLGLAVPVLNMRECSNAACHVHPPDQRVLGMLDLELSTLHLDQAIQADRHQLMVLALATVLLISAIIGFLAWRVVHRPMHALLMGTRHLGSGDLSYRITDQPSGEVGELAVAFNEMSSRLQEALNELEDWNQTLEAKVAMKTHELEETRDQMVLAEKMVSLGKLAAIVAHEINNPLAGVLVYTKLIRRQLPRLLPDPRPEEKDGKYREMDEKLATIEAEVARCGDIVRNLLLFSRHRDSPRVPGEINPVVTRSVGLIQHQAQLAEITTHLDLDPNLPQVTCEIGQVQQAVLAAIMNGLEAMPDGGTLTLRTRHDSDRDEVRIEIQDTGMGIPKDIQGKIFEPFFSTKSEGKGTGLGLSVMYGIIHRHEGRIELDSVPGEGTTFRLVLPVNPKGEDPTSDVFPKPDQGEPRS